MKKEHLEGCTMNDAFIASFCHNGVLGGAIYLEENKATYRTNKLTVDVQYRNLEMLYSDMTEISAGRAFLFPTVTILLKNTVSYIFIVFSQRKFLSRINELIR